MDPDLNNVSGFDLLDIIGRGIKAFSESVVAYIPVCRYIPHSTRKAFKTLLEALKCTVRYTFKIFHHFTRDLTNFNWLDSKRFPRSNPELIFIVLQQTGRTDLQCDQFFYLRKVDNIKTIHNKDRG